MDHILPKPQNQSRRRWWLLSTTRLMMLSWQPLNQSTHRQPNINFNFFSFYISKKLSLWRESSIHCFQFSFLEHLTCTYKYERYLPTMYNICITLLDWCDLWEPLEASLFMQYFYVVGCWLLGILPFVWGWVVIGSQSLL